MATTGPVLFGLPSTIQPGGHTSCVVRSGPSLPGPFAGLPVPLGCGTGINRGIAGSRPGNRGSRVVRLRAVGPTAIATEATNFDPDPGTIGPTIDLPIGRDVEICLEDGVNVFGLGTSFVLAGLFLLMDVGADCICVGEP